MSTTDITIRPASQQDLVTINQLIAAAVMTWDLPERVKRLSLPSYFYNEVDLKHFEIIVAVQNKIIVGVAACEEVNPEELPANKTGLLLHGLYIDTDSQKQSIGTQLLIEIEKITKDKGLDGLLVKAQKDAIPFFIKQGMQPLKITNPDKNYEKRFWKIV